MVKSVFPAILYCLPFRFTGLLLGTFNITLSLLLPRSYLSVSGKGEPHQTRSSQTAPDNPSPGPGTKVCYRGTETISYYS